VQKNDKTKMVYIQHTGKCNRVIKTMLYMLYMVCTYHKDTLILQTRKGNYPVWNVPKVSHTMSNALYILKHHIPVYTYMYVLNKKFIKYKKMHRGATLCVQYL
jgi:hypothetical protein